MDKYTYLLLHLFTLLFPLGYSFEKKIAYYKSWKYLFPSILAVASFFISWDFYFTASGVWEFNDQYVIGWFLAKLPVEEWLFFITVPFSCVFIHQSLKHFVKKDYLLPFADLITAFIVIGLLLVAAWNVERIYTFCTALLTSFALILHRLFLGKTRLGRFYLTYAVHLIPFFIVNGVLTALPVVIYNNSENLGWRIGTIPVEDAFYSMLLLLLNITLYEYLMERVVGKNSKDQNATHHLNKSSLYVRSESNH